MSGRTKQCRTLKNLFGFISYALWIGTLLFLVIVVFSRIETPDEVTGEVVEETTRELLSEETKNLLLSISTTAIIGILGTIIIKDKIRTFIWMLSLIAGVILFNEVAMYIILGMWFVDEYIIHALFKHYKNLFTINKEIDLR